jgi:hypothetical protein
MASSFISSLSIQTLNFRSSGIENANLDGFISVSNFKNARSSHSQYNFQNFSTHLDNHLPGSFSQTLANGQKISGKRRNCTQSSYCCVFFVPGAAPFGSQCLLLPTLVCFG